VKLASSSVSGLLRGEHEVDGLAADHAVQFVRGLRAQRADRDAGVAQGADDGLGRLDAVVDDHQAQRVVGAFCH
jgi:hypothetical protein